MAGGLLFVSQALIDTWAEQGRIDFVGNVMTLLAGDGRGRRYALEPAVRFLKVLGVERDPHQLLAKVKPVAQLRAMGAEAVENSVVLGDAAYEVEPGFLAEVSAIEAAVNAPLPDASSRPQPASPRPEPRAPQAPSAAAPAAPPPRVDRGARPAGSPRDLEERRKEAEALARFLLDNLS